METQTRKAEVVRKIIETGESLFDIVWYKADERRAASLEIIARTAYTVEESACHDVETIDLDRKGRIPEMLKLTRHQDINERTHDDIFQEISTACRTGAIDSWHVISLSSFTGFLLLQPSSAMNWLLFWVKRSRLRQ